MKNTPRSLLRDIKAAVRLGSPEAVNTALDRLLTFPGVAANARMDEAFIGKVILPLGEALTPLTAAQLRALAEHPLAARRAVGAVSLAYRFLADGEITPRDLRRFARDSRPDVRAALAQALSLRGAENSQKLFNLGEIWLQDQSPKVRSTALTFLPVFAESRGESLLALLSPLLADSDREVRAALADALTALGRAGLTEPVLDLLARQEAEPNPNSWVIRRVRGRLSR